MLDRRFILTGLALPLTLACTGADEVPTSDLDVASTEQALSSVLDSTFYSYEVIPNAVRANSGESFVLELNPASDIVSLSATLNHALITGPTNLSFHDDGLNRDRVAGDGVFTIGPFTYSGTAPNIELAQQSFIQIQMLTASGAARTFLIPPEIIIVDPALPTASRTLLGSAVSVGSHLIELRNGDGSVQRQMRGAVNSIATRLFDIYSVLPDFFDFAIMASTSHIERVDVPFYNSVAGMHLPIKANYTGHGGGTFDNTSAYGSAGRLLSVNFLDSGSRGWYSGNFVHEMLHQWSAFLPTSLEITAGDGHYEPGTNAASLVGGFTWVQNPNGSYTLDCAGNSRNGSSRIAPLDAYMAGFIPASEVPPIHRFDYQNNLSQFCGQVIPSIERTVTISEIQSVVGVRTPLPAAAQKDFRLAFIIEAEGRALTDTEFTYYNEMARIATAAVPAADPDPFLAFNWKPIGRYFGHGTTWRSDISTQLGCTSGQLSTPSATASSSQSASLAAGFAIDRNVATRWSSAFSDPQTLTIDLGTSRYIDRVVLDWEAAYSASYQLQVAASAAGPFVTIHTRTGKTSAADDTISGLRAQGRYLRLLSTARGTAFGVSLFEVSVYGDSNPSCSICSNAVLEGSEQCDDGNAVNTDSCSNSCVVSTCSDGVLNQNETGIDCGGVCNACQAAPVIADALLANCVNCTNQGTFLDMNANSTLSFNGVDGRGGGTATLRFAAASPSGTRVMGVYLNGTKVGTVTVTSPRPTMVEVPTAGLTVTLLAGANTIELRDSEGANEPDVDYLRVDYSATPASWVTAFTRNVAAAGWDTGTFTAVTASAVRFCFQEDSMIEVMEAQALSSATTRALTLSSNPGALSNVAVLTDGSTAAAATVATTVGSFKCVEYGMPTATIDRARIFTDFTENWQVDSWRFEYRP